MKKNLLCLLLAAGMLLSLAACASQPPPPAAVSAPEKAAEEAQVMETVTVNGVELGMGLRMEEAPTAAMDENPDRTIDRAVEPIKPAPSQMLDGTPLSMDFYYYRSTLDATKQQAYDLLRAGMLKGEKKIKMTVPIKSADAADLYKKIIYDSPELFWVTTGGMRYWHNKKDEVTFLEPGYNDLVNDIAGNTARLEEAAAEALSDIWSLPTQAEKAKYAHDYLTHSITYTFDCPYDQTIYSALVNGQSVCAGYSHAFQYLMQKMGIPCTYVLGYAAGGYHAWNLVQLDGEYYAMDVTWDDPLGSPPERYKYDYFNLTDQAMSADHVRLEISASLPVAAGTACSFPNAFGGTAYGTDFSGIVGTMPEKVSGGAAVEKNPYLS